MGCNESKQECDYLVIKEIKKLPLLKPRTLIILLQFFLLEVIENMKSISLKYKARHYI